MYQPPLADPGSRWLSLLEQLRDVAFLLLLFGIVCSSVLVARALELQPPFDWLPLLASAGLALLMASLYARRWRAARSLAALWLGAAAVALALLGLALG